MLYRICLALILAAGFAFSVDTLHVLAIMVEFRQDALDDQTTGNGKFNSVDNFALNPKSHNKVYFEEQLEFARRYFARVSSGKIVVRYSVADTVLALDKQMRHYRMPSKRPEDSNNDFIKELNLGLMSFAHDALRAASEADLLNERIAGASTRHPLERVVVKKDSTLILFFHAGASGLTDGGGMGGIMADTPSDIIDSYIWPEDFKYYHGEVYDDRTGVVPPAPVLYDTHSVNLDRRGIYSSDSSNFVDKMLMCSETASQDSLVFGINGIVVNQIARGMGLPDLWNTSTGGTAVGSFCLMDVGGYNTVSGFIPLMPSAWCRKHMGWSNVLTPPDSVTSRWIFTLPSILHGDTIAKIPLSATEYILLENRQWMRHSDSFLTVDASLRRSVGSRDTLYDSTFAYTKKGVFDPYYYGKDYGPFPGSWARLIADSLCVDTPKCENRKLNPDKLNGVVLSSSSYDIGLPGNGVLMWHVNDKVIRDNLVANMVNADITNRGVDLKEADGIEDVGADYRDIFGQKSDAYGDQEDFYPHYSGKSRRFINALTPFNGSDSFLTNSSNTDRYENTSTRDGGYTGITIKIDTLPGTAIVREYYGSWGEKIKTYAADQYKVTVDWMQRQGAFPVYSVPNDSIRCILVSTIAPDTNILLAVTDSSIVYRMDTRGRNSVADSSIRNSGFRLLNSVMPSVKGDKLYYFAAKNSADSLYINSYSRSANISIVALSAETATVPMVIAGADSLVAGFGSGLILRTMGSSIVDTLKMGSTIRALAGNNEQVIVVAGNKISRINFATFSKTTMSSRTIALAGSGLVGLALGDFFPDRAGLEIVLNDGSGNVWMVDSALNVLPSWPVRIDASRMVPPAVGDVDGDGFLDIVISGNNKIHAISRNGVALTGWPYTISWSANDGYVHSSVSLADIDGDGAQEVFAPLASGPLSIIDNDGKTYGFVSVARTYGLSLPLGGNPVNGCILGHFDTDSAAGVPEHLEVFALTSEGTIQGFNVQLSGRRGKVAWGTPYGGLARNSVASYAENLPVTRYDYAVDTMFVWPNPVKGSKANLRYKLSRKVDKVSVKIINAAGSIVFERSGIKSESSWNEYPLMLNRLAPGFYNLRLEIEGNGKKVVRFANFGLVR